MSNKNNYPQSSYKVGYWTFKLYFVAGCKCVFLMYVLTHIWREPLVATRGTVCFCHFALTSLEVTLNNANSANSSYVWTDLSASRFRGSLFLVRHTRCFGNQVAFIDNSLSDSFSVHLSKSGGLQHSVSLNRVHTYTCAHRLKNIQIQVLQKMHGKMQQKK